MIGRSVLSVLMLIASQYVLAQGNWQLVKNTDGIKVYTRLQPLEKFKEVKADFEARGTEDGLINIVGNIQHQKDWSYGTKRTMLIAKKNKDTIIYYSEISMPWPLSNRDLVIQLTFKKDTVDNILHIQAKSITGILPPKRDLVRVPFSLAEWEVKSLPNKMLDIQYTLRADPGGALPAWLVNLAATVGPYNSFQKLKALLTKENNH
ncbi:MAG: hypothetical protein JSU01_01390 [Bacteroidetes bacterium]|nr:hypothetical protein [Bacteroidota bacterium]